MKAARKPRTTLDMRFEHIQEMFDHENLRYYANDKNHTITITAGDNEDSLFYADAIEDAVFEPTPDDPDMRGAYNKAVDFIDGLTSSRMRRKAFEMTYAALKKQYGEYFGAFITEMQSRYFSDLPEESPCEFASSSEWSESSSLCR